MRRGMIAVSPELAKEYPSHVTDVFDMIGFSTISVEVDETNGNWLYVGECDRFDDIHEEADTKKYSVTVTIDLLTLWLTSTKRRG